MARGYQPAGPPPSNPAANPNSSPNPAPNLPDNGTQYVAPPSGAQQSPYSGADMQAPAVPGGATHPGQGVRTVSTTALKTFNKNIATLMAPLRQAQQDLQSMQPIRAGALGAGREFETAVSGGNKNDGSSLQETTLAVLLGLENAIGAVQTSMNAVISTYTTTGDLNGLTANNLADTMGATTGYIDQFNPNPSST